MNRVLLYWLFSLADGANHWPCYVAFQANTPKCFQGSHRSSVADGYTVAAAVDAVLSLAFEGHEDREEIGGCIKTNTQRRYAAADFVWAKSDFVTDDILKKTIKQGTGGVIIRIDEFGDALIDFDGISGGGWVSTKNLHVLEFHEHQANKKYSKTQKRYLEARAQRRMSARQVPTLVQQATDNGLRICIDCSYSASSKSCSLIANQLAFSISANRKAEKPISLHVSSVTGELTKAVEINGGVNWEVEMHADDVFDVFTSDEIVYLTPDATETLSRVDPTKVYVIGGIIDRTPTPRLSLNRAQEHKVEVRALPLTDFVSLSGKKSLNINHVIEILIALQTNSDWKEILENILPPRQLRGSSNAEAAKRKIANRGGSGVLNQEDLDQHDGHFISKDGSFNEEIEKKLNDWWTHWGDGNFEVSDSIRDELHQVGVDPQQHRNPQMLSAKLDVSQ